MGHPESPWVARTSIRPRGIEAELGRNREAPYSTKIDIDKAPPEFRLHGVTSSPNRWLSIAASLWPHLLALQEKISAFIMEHCV